MIAKLTAEEIIEKCKIIPSSVFEPEQEMWQRVISQLPDNLTIVDFGTGWGKSACSLALVNPTNTIYTFDPGLPYINDGRTAEEYELAVHNYAKEVGVDNLIFFRQSSLEIPWEREIDVLNIDSDHTYETTLKEIDRWIPFVKMGGHVFFHDYEHVRCPGVRQAIDELIPAKFPMELIEVTDAGAVKCAHYLKK